jgi:nucleoredoxin
MKTPKLLLPLLLLASLANLFAGGRPITAQELALMARMDFSEQEILREVGTRKLMRPLDAATEKALREKGAGEALITALKDGGNVVPAEVAARLEHEDSSRAAVPAAPQQQEQQGQRLPVGRQQYEEMRKFLASPYPTSDKMLRKLHGKLVEWREGDLRDYDEAKLARVRWYAVYFSAHWCGPCRQFTPKLVEYYRQTKAQHPQFEVVFVSRDRSLMAMKGYMQEAGMPWPAMQWKVSEPDIEAAAGDGIPCLVLFDETGRMVSHSYRNGKYVGPQAVLNDLTTLLKAAAAAERGR